MSHPLQQSEKIWSLAAGDVNVIWHFSKKHTYTHTHTTHPHPPSLYKCRHVCWLWFSAVACFSSLHLRESIETDVLSHFSVLSPSLPLSRFQSLLLWQKSVHIQKYVTYQKNNSSHIEVGMCFVWEHTTDTTLFGEHDMIIGVGNAFTGIKALFHPEEKHFISG